MGKKDAEITGLKARLERNTSKKYAEIKELNAEIKELKREKREVEIEAEETQYMVQKVAAENEASMQEQLKTRTFHPGMRLAIREEASSTEYSAIVQTFDQ